jgi:hypothetical protein
MVFEGFLLGVIATASVAAALFFLRFWRASRDPLFLAFALAFFIEGLNRASILLIDRPSEGNPRIYIVRCIAFLIILAGIVNKNRRAS